MKLHGARGTGQSWDLLSLRAMGLLLNVMLFLSGPTTLFHSHLGRDVEVAEFERCDNLMLTACPL